MLRIEDSELGIKHCKIVAFYCKLRVFSTSASGYIPVKFKAYDSRFGAIVLAFPKMNDRFMVFSALDAFISLSGSPPIMNTPTLAPSNEYGLIPTEN